MFTKKKELMRPYINISLGARRILWWMAYQGVRMLLAFKLLIPPLKSYMGLMWVCH